MPVEGNYSTWLEAKAKRMAQEEREEAGRQKAINEELEWIRQSPKARQTKSTARIRAFDELVETTANRAPGQAQIAIQTPERPGSTLTAPKRPTQASGERPLLTIIDFTLPHEQH